MGLLDEAIRDHLELKRRRGADPSEIARAEHEALDPVLGEGSTGAAPVPEGPFAAGEASDQPVGELAEPVEYDLRDESSELDIESDLTTVGQETVEIDMQALLDQDARAVSDGRMTAVIRARAFSNDGAPPARPDGDPLDWEVPDRISAEGRPEQIRGQERLSFE